MNSRHFLGLTLLAAALLHAAPPPASAQFATTAEPRGGKPVTLNFDNAEIESVARTIAVITGRDVLVDPRVKGTLTLTTDREIAPAAAFDQFAAALRLQGYAVVEVDGLFKVLPEADAKLQGNGTGVSVGAGAPSRHGSRVATRVFRINHESAAGLLPVLRPLIPPNNTINVNVGNNSLVVTDYADNLDRIARIVALLDVPNATEVEVIPLEHTVASEMLPLVTRLLEGGSGTPGNSGGSSGGADGPFRTALTADPRSNSLLLRAANPSRATLVRTLVEKLDRARPGTSAAGNIHVVRLKNADAVRLATTLRAAMAAGQSTAAGAGGAGGSSSQGLQASIAPAPSGGSGSGSPQASAPLNNANQPSTGGQIQADPSSNALIITAPEPQYRELLAVIAELDGRRAQVLIEALIVEVNASKAASFGLQWQTALGNAGAGGFNSGAGTDSGKSNILGLAAGLAGGKATAAMALPNLAPGLNLGVLGKFAGRYGLGALANFFAGDSDANLLSTPNLMTLDNEEARIVVGRNVPFVTGSYSNLSTGGASPFTTVERKDVGLTLRVRPQINENGTVKLVVFQEIADVETNSTTSPNGPSTTKRAIDSTVLVEDGGIVLLGGMLSDTYSETQDKIPLAGDIPVLGTLFRTERRTREKKNLMMFLRPVVLRDAPSAASFAAGRYEEARDMQTRVQPDADNIMLRNVQSAPVLPALPAEPRGSIATHLLRDTGTVLIPPPEAARSMRQQEPGPLRGALPPTSDPASAREGP